MRHSRYLVSDAHMWPAVVVEMDESSDYVPCVFQTVEGLHRVDGFGLDYTIGTLCDGVVRRVIVLGHADLDFMFLECSHIVVTAELYATVRVMYQPFQGYATSL